MRTKGLHDVTLVTYDTHAFSTLLTLTPMRLEFVGVLASRQFLVDPLALRWIGRLLQALVERLQLEVAICRNVRLCFGN